MRGRIFFFQDEGEEGNAVKEFDAIMDQGGSLANDAAALVAELVLVTHGEGSAFLAEQRLMGHSQESLLGRHRFKVGRVEAIAELGLGHHSPQALDVLVLHVFIDDGPRAENAPSPSTVASRRVEAWHSLGSPRDEEIS